MSMRSAIFWDYRRFGTTVSVPSSMIKKSNTLEDRTDTLRPLKMGQICTKTSVKYYHSTLRNISEERISLLRGFHIHFYVRMCGVVPLCMAQGLKRQDNFTACSDYFGGDTEKCGAENENIVMWGEIPLEGKPVSINSSGHVWPVGLPSRSALCVTSNETGTELIMF